MMRINRNILITGIIAVAMICGCMLGLGVHDQVKTAYATEFENIAVSELQIVLHRYDHSTSSTTFEGGKYLHINPSYETVETNSSSAGADMEYDVSTGVLKLYDTDNISNYKGDISLYGLNTSDKQLTIEDYYNGFDFYILAFEKGNLTIENTSGNPNSVGGISWQNKFKINGELTIRGNTVIRPYNGATGYNTSVNNIIEAGTLKLLDNASLIYNAGVNDNVYSLVYVNSLVLNTDGELNLNSKNEPDTKKVLYTNDVTLTKCGRITLAGPDNYTDKLTNSTYLRNAPTTPISGYYATIIENGNAYDGYLKTYYLISNSKKFKVSFDSYGGTGTMAPVENVNGVFVLPECTFTPPEVSDYNLEFKCWSDKSYGGKQYAVGDTITLYQNITLYALWQKAQTYTIQFYGNDGSGSMPAVNTTGVYTLPACTFTAPENKVFKCWEIKGNYYSVGDEYVVTDNLSIYAVWENMSFTQQPISQARSLDALDTEITPDWDVNFTATKYEVVENSVVTDTVNHKWFSVDSNVASTRTLTIRAYFDDTHYITSDEFTLTWTSVTLRVIYSPGEGSGTNEIFEYESNNSVKLLPCNYFSFSLTGHEFDYWSIRILGDNETEVAEKNPGETYQLASNEIVIVAIWKEKQIDRFIAAYSDTYVVAGSLIDPSKIILRMYYTDGSVDVKDNNQVGFMVGTQAILDITIFEFDTVGTTNIKVTCENKESIMKISVAGFRVVLNSNNEDDLFQITEDVYGQYTLPTTCLFNAPEGKEFDGWALSSNGNKINETTINVDSDTVLFAIWEDIPVDPEQTEQPENPNTTETPSNNGGISAGAIVGIVLGSIVVLGGAGFCVYWFVFRKKKIVK